MVKYAKFLIALLISFNVCSAGMDNTLMSLSASDSLSGIQRARSNHSMVNLTRQPKDRFAGDPFSWEIKKGQSLEETLYLWSKKAGWNLVWETNDDYMITSSAVIPGDFSTAINNLFNYTGQLQPPVYISLYDNNRVLRVSSVN
ncbi:hypothetical protein BL250_10535 [Erwinia sp. OLTSP20]|uniref:toxin co-regulated pilus biosynthesis Q family protein n=1 Tax=unclassified Erwinia TaxID=2622719 RepID=UPI000C1995AB|nr:MULTISPECIES: toxin co-regulated pilus biosynthesis Q family protein [unclassified Erwinia]PIJ49836.1 hypothetical protein BV501_11665 [Erwinia sp. OAMSP11]PIJ70935.1 hypothetical protein BK416_12855 [Erwinia sp. OLSSP12]PIJ80301.1 hypothetical protein BLD47_11720 [Erwinia sp. OLCASP19]PIJ82425.1 hypothetical protein BLD46_11470 [Erwinia sp. OLMTSP26]PIJ85110.1 hypothetical protein BLD49_11580 [Erwinia sp. OLMDSP33]